MIAAWIVYGVVVGALAMGVAALLHALRRDSGNAVRGIWAGAILVTIGLSASAPWRVAAPIVRISISNATERGNVTTTVVAPTLAEQARALFDRVVNTTSAPLTKAMSEAMRLPTSVQRAALGGCVALTIGAVLWLISMYARTLLLRRSWERDNLLGVPVRVAPHAGPAVIGVAPPEIVVPRWLLDRAPNEQRLVLEHEQAHVRAHDPLLLLAACLAVALMPWNPALWYMLSRLRLAVELDCDRRVLRAGAPTRSYAQLLIELSAHRSLLSPAVPSFSHSISHLERRLLAMTTRPNRASLSVRLGGALLTAAALLAACESKLPTSAEVQDMTAATAAKRAAEFTVMDTLRTSYIIDGRAATKAEADAIPSQRIASVEVNRATTGQANSVVSIQTRAAADTAREPSKVSIRTKGTASNFRVTGSSDSTRTMTIQLNDSASRMGEMKIVERTGTPKPTTRLSTADQKPFDGLLIVDGVVTEASKMNGIAPSTILSVEVIKGPSALQKYTDPRAANGVIVITTKKK